MADDRLNLEACFNGPKQVALTGANMARTSSFSPSPNVKFGYDRQAGQDRLCECVMSLSACLEEGDLQVRSNG